VRYILSFCLFVYCVYEFHNNNNNNIAARIERLSRVVYYEKLAIFTGNLSDVVYRTYSPSSQRRDIGMIIIVGLPHTGDGASESTRRHHWRPLSPPPSILRRCWVSRHLVCRRAVCCDHVPRKHHPFITGLRTDDDDRPTVHWRHAVTWSPSQSRDRVTSSIHEWTAMPSITRRRLGYRTDLSSVFIVDDDENDNCVWLN